MIKNHIVYNPSADYRIKFARAEDSYIYDDAGKRYIDFTSGWNVTNLGWNHPEIAEAVVEQARKNVYVPFWGADSVQEEYAEKLTAALPKELNACIKTTSGTEAVEVAIKIARAASGRKKIIGFKNSYHGQLFASMSLCMPANLTQAMAPLVPEFVQIDFPRNTGDEQVLQHFRGELDALLSKKDVAAIVCEPGIITGRGSVYVAPPGFLSAIRELTIKYGTLLIVDEVGTGFSRTGKLFGIEQESVVPDMICFAKAIANGAAAIGAVVGKSDVIESANPLANLTATFGWTSIACAASIKALEIHQREQIWEQSQSKGRYMMDCLKSRLSGNPEVVDIRGIGMEIGVEIKHSIAFYHKVSTTAAKNGLHLVGDPMMSLIQIMPPLTISERDIDEGVEILANAIAPKK